MIRTEDEARRDFGDVNLNRFGELVGQGLSDFTSKHALLRADQSKRSEASNIHDYMVLAARGVLADVAGFNLSKVNNLFLIHFDGKYSIKLKKLSERLIPSNIDTQQVIEFREQAPQYTLPLFPAEPTNLFLGYQRFKEALDLTTAPIWLVCPRGFRIAWAIRLNAQASSAVPGLPIIPATPAPEDSGAKRVKVREVAEVGSEEQKGKKSS